MRLIQSIEEILTRADIADSFYELLFEEHPEMKPLFRSTNMKRQKVMVTLALQTIGYHYRHPNAAMSAFLQHLGETHRERGIAPQELIKFRDTMLVALANFHADDWSDELCAEWTTALDDAIGLMNLA